MDRGKEIEKICAILRMCRKYFEEEFEKSLADKCYRSPAGDKSLDDLFAEAIVAADYRKADEVRKETAKEILQELHGWEVLLGSDNPVDGKVEELAEMYGVEVEP